jgi:hypothetical protein
MFTGPIHIARGGKEIATCDASEIDAKLRAGELTATDFYWRAGMAGWKPLGELAALRPPLPFPRPEEREPNLLDGLLGRGNRTSGLVLLWDKLAAAPVECRVSEEEIAQIDEQVGYKVRNRCREELEGWYRAAVAAYLADRLFTPQESANLGNLAATLGLGPEKALGLHREAFTLYLTAGLRTCLERNAGAEEKARQIAELTRQVPLPPEAVAAVRSAVFGELLSKQVEAALTQDDGDELIDPARVKVINDQAMALGVRMSAELPELTVRMREAEALWGLYRAPLQPVGCDLDLGAEGCYWTAQVDFYQKKRVTVRRSYGGFSSSVRIFGSLRYRVGNYAVERETEDQVVKIDSGTLAFTAQRVIFKGEIKNFNFKYAKVLDVTAYSNALVIARDTGGDNIFLFPSGQKEAAVILRRLVRQAKG